MEGRGILVCLTTNCGSKQLQRQISDVKACQTNQEIETEFQACAEWSCRSEQKSQHTIMASCRSIPLEFQDWDELVNCFQDDGVHIGASDDILRLNFPLEQMWKVRHCIEMLRQYDSVADCSVDVGIRRKQVTHLLFLNTLKKVSDSLDLKVRLHSFKASMKGQKVVVSEDLGFRLFFLTLDFLQDTDEECKALEKTIRQHVE